MGKIKQDEEYQTYLKNYADLLKTTNPKPDISIIEMEIRKRLEERERA